MSKKVHNQVSLTFRIKEMKLVEFDALSKMPDKYIETGLDINHVQFEYNINTNINVKKDRIQIYLNVKFFAEETKVTFLGKLKSFSEYSVQDFEKSVSKSKGQIPNVFLASLVGILLSTSRGFLVLKSKGTVMEGIIMPLINPNVFFPPNTVQKPN